jgi:WD40 repeat protein
LGPHSNLVPPALWTASIFGSGRLHPTCEECKRNGETWPAVLAHHITAHNGDPIKFFNGRLESLCRPCHERKHGRFARDFDTIVDPTSGWPIDERHPANPCGNRVICGLDDGTIRIWNRSEARLERVLSFPGKAGALLVTPDGTQIIAASKENGPIRLWDIASGEELEPLGSDREYSASMAITPNGKCLILGGYFKVVSMRAFEDPTVRVWDLKAKELLEELRSHHRHISALAISGDGNSLLTASSDHTVKLWDIGPTHNPVPTESSLSTDDEYNY